jgi:hypothetical protein
VTSQQANNLLVAPSPRRLPQPSPGGPKMHLGRVVISNARAHRSTTAVSAPQGGARTVAAIFLFACCRLAAYHRVPEGTGIAGFSHPRNVLHPVASRSVLPSSVAISVASVRQTFPIRDVLRVLGRGAPRWRDRHRHPAPQRIRSVPGWREHPAGLSTPCGTVRSSARPADHR